MNIIGKCVVAGNVRRTAEIAFGSPYSDEYISLKDYSINPHRAAYAWTSNNSVFADIGMDYGPTAAKVQLNGEPGFAWLENMRAFGRMGDPANYKDHRARGGNPCLEQTLESYEICCLVETFPDKHETLDDFKKTLNLAVTYAKTVTLGSTHWPQTNNVMLRNRRIGTSLSGIAQFISSRGIEKLKDWCEAGYQQVQESDERLSGLFGIPKSIKTTCIKPSGITISNDISSSCSSSCSFSFFFLFIFFVFFFFLSLLLFLFLSSPHLYINFYLLLPNPTYCYRYCIPSCRGNSWYAFSRK